MFGRLTLDAFKHDWIEYVRWRLDGVWRYFLHHFDPTYKRWKWLWNEWV